MDRRRQRTFSEFIKQKFAKKEEVLSKNNFMTWLQPTRNDKIGIIIFWDFSPLLVFRHNFWLIVKNQLTITVKIVVTVDRTLWINEN